MSNADPGTDAGGTVLSLLLKRPPNSPFPVAFEEQVEHPSALQLLNRLLFAGWDKAGLQVLQGAPRNHFRNGPLAQPMVETSIRVANEAKTKFLITHFLAALAA